MAPALVLELQHDALSRDVSVSDLLRKAMVVARKLNIQEFQEWIEGELSGYREGATLPDYRELKGLIKGWNPYNGWIPVIFEDPNEAEILSKRKCGQTIAEIENMVQGKSYDGTFHMPFPHKFQKMLSKGFPIETQVSLFFQESGLIKILDAVRTIILNWTLRLEEDGIFGEGMTFSKQERENAEEKTYNVNNFFGPVHSPQIQQDTKKSVQIIASFTVDPIAISTVLSKIREAIPDLDLSTEMQAEVEADMQTMEAQIKSPKPKGSIVKESLQSIKRILEGAAGGVASSLLTELGKILL